MTLTRTDREDARTWLCHTLSPWFAADTPSAPPDRLWPEIVRLADAWLVSPRLNRRLAETGVAPDAARDVLSAISAYADLRADAMRAELRQIIGACNAAGLEPVVMKGAEWLMGHYAPEGERLISDLDLWLPTHSEQQAAIAVLQRMDYAPVTPLADHDPARHHHFPPFHKDGAVARVELHHRPVRPTLIDATDLGDAADRLLPAQAGPLRYRRLSGTDGITVAFLQSGRMAAPAFETRAVAIAKWLDLMDRTRCAGLSHVESARDLGIRGDPDTVDVQLLTALSVKFGFPYTGPHDTAYIDTWTAPRPRRAVLVEGLAASLRWENLRDPRAWRRFWGNIPLRLRMARFLER